MRPANTEPIGAAQLHVLLALVTVYERYGRATMRDVAEEARRALGTTHHHLEALQDAGLVAWEPESKGTLRPLLVYATRVVA